MMRLENIEKYLQKKNIPYYMTEGRKIIIAACVFDSEQETNFYDYGEPHKEPQCYNEEKFYQELFNDPRIIIADCSECCGCAGW